MNTQAYHYQLTLFALAIIALAFLVTGLMYGFAASLSVLAFIICAVWIAYRILDSRPSARPVSALYGVRYYRIGMEVLR